MNPDRPLRILLVEDSEPDFLLIQHMLSTPGNLFCQLEWAATVKVARERIFTEKFDVFLFDSRLGGDTGQSLLASLKEYLSNKPVILLTGAENDEVDQHAIELGAADYLVKGNFNARTLMRAIRYACERKQAEVTLRQSSDRLKNLVAAQHQIAMAGTDVASVAQVICEQAQMLTQASGAVMEMQEGDQMVYRVGSGCMRRHLGLRRPVNASLSGLSVRTNELQKCDDTRADERVSRAAVELAEIRAMIVVPLTHHDKTPGVLKVVSDQPNRFGEVETQLLRLMGGLAAAAFGQASDFAAKQKLIKELSEALANVKTLGGLLPICAHCKKIRDDKGYWNQIELFLRDHSAAKFSHGICPECAKAAYPDLYAQMQKK